MFNESVSIWNYLKDTPKPIVIYGMGNGADKILAVMERRGITPAAFMASDEFVRGHSFRGFEVRKLGDIEAQFGDFIILVAFGTNLPAVVQKIYTLGNKYEVLAPDVPVYGDVHMGLFDEQFVESNAQKIAQVRGLFADEQSKKTFDALINYKISGKLNYLQETVSCRDAAIDLLCLKKNGSEIFFDFGAYDGDTVQEFIEITGGNFSKIYAFEPDFRNFCKLRRRHYLLEPDKLEAVNAAAADKDGAEDFNSAGGRQSALSPNVGKTKKVVTISADSFSEHRAIKPDYIKFDVEGGEKAALTGAAELLKKHKPKLAVSLYHRNEDLLDLPLLISGSNSKYKMYLRRHEYIPAWDINLYCV
ncbi:MAG: FkbM family methyltransferase [Oscillospiraceae bacterium]|nr:FkbM family methyltransferase [Oscillospiraceae bacterium]